jgi:hypothetical protein
LSINLPFVTLLKVIIFTEKSESSGFPVGENRQDKIQRLIAEK